MTTPLTTYAPVRPGDVHKAIYGLAGTYTAADIYQRYTAVVREAGREPAHPIAVGQELKRQGCTRRKVKRQSAWFI